MMGELIGRFHPLIVHLPIGMLVLAFCMECAARTERFKKIHSAIPFVLFATMVSAVLSWITGWIMPKEGLFDDGLVGLHFWFAAAMTITTAITYLLYIEKNARWNKWYFPTLCLTMILLIMTGHFGGSLTHGEDFLTKPISNDKAIMVSDVNQLMVYPDMIKPIFKKKCNRCHNEGKKKGKLIMETIEQLTKGGEEGPALIVNNSKESAMVLRAHLPIEDEKHMPPEGKRQLTNNELKLIEWWIDNGALNETKISQIERSEEIDRILKSYEKTESHLDSSNLALVTEEKIQDFLNDGIIIQKEHEQSPFVSANLSRDTTITRRKIRKLSNLEKNITSLDLSFSNADNKMLAELDGYHNLTNLKLQKSRVNTEGLKHLKDLKNIQVLNLYGTSVDDQIFDLLKDLHALKKLYIWQTEVTDSIAIAFQEANPNLEVIHNIDAAIFKDARLKPPIILAEKKFFEDTLQIELKLNFSNVEIYYTTDGSIPDSTSNLYSAPFLIEETSSISAISMKKGWQTSEIAEDIFVQARYKVATAQLAKPPNQKYKANGAKSLIDFEKGSTNFVDNKWLGYEGENMTATLDLGSIESIQNVTVSALENTGSYIFFPKSISISISRDGKKFTLANEIDIPLATGPTPVELKSFLIDFEPQNAQYIKTLVKGTLKNPPWHSAPGAKNWIFIDEILVN